MIRGYGLFSAIGLGISLIYTKWLSRNARIIRLPFHIRNAHYITFGKGFTTGRYCRIDALPQTDVQVPIVSFGENCHINDGVHVAGVQRVTIGNNVLIASRVFISDHNHGSYAGQTQSHPDKPPAARPLYSAPVEIGDNVWIGEGVAILPGVTIGKGCIIGSNSVVTKDLPDHTICVGSPAKVIKIFDAASGQWRAVA